MLPLPDPYQQGRAGVAPNMGQRDRVVENKLLPPPPPPPPHPGHRPSK